jgi:hypothetical protein
VSQAPTDAPAGAVIKGRYRYLLWRTVEEQATGTVLFIMLNPSTANAKQDDPTLRRCIGYTRRWGFSKLEICNLFAFRTKEPRQLMTARSPIGPVNDLYIQSAASRAQLIVAAWGSHGDYLGRGNVVLSLLQPKHTLHVLRLTRSAHPAHPLYLKGNAIPSVLI